VFANTVGRAENKDNLRNRHTRAAAEKAGAAWMGHPTLRHTFASLHIARGTNVALPVDEAVSSSFARAGRRPKVQGTWIAATARALAVAVYRGRR
jgi:hypothetical protein